MASATRPRDGKAVAPLITRIVDAPRRNATDKPGSLTRSRASSRNVELTPVNTFTAACPFEGAGSVPRAFSFVWCALVKCRNGYCPPQAQMQVYSARAQSCMVTPMRKLLLVILITLGSCTRPAAPSGEALSTILAGRTAGPPRSCVLTRPEFSLHAVDQTTITYGSGSTVYVNRLGPCPGLRELSTIFVVSASSGQYCRGDRIRANEPGSIIPGPTCNLGDWIPYRRS